MEGEPEEVKPKAGEVEVKKEENLGSGKEASDFFEKNGVPLWTSGSRPPTMTSSGPNATMPSPEQLTVFYGGRVFVFDAIPKEKVHEIMLIATAAAAAAGAIKSNDMKKTDSVPPTSTPVLTRSPSMQSTASVLASPPAQLYPINKPSLCKFQANLPITRRHSLQRFFEKRRDRLVSKSPYPLPATGKTAETAKPDISVEDLPLPQEEELKTQVAGNVA